VTNHRLDENKPLLRTGRVSALKTVPEGAPIGKAAMVAVVGTLVLITITVIVSDVVAAPGVARDVVRAMGTQLVTLSGSAWQKRCASRKPAQICTRCCGEVQGSGLP
jgi:hypothetical protein